MSNHFVDEDALIRELVRRLPPPPPEVVLGVGDDAAVLVPPREGRLLVSTDSLVEDVHFRFRESLARFVGRKALSTAASDLAAMGGELSSALLSLHIGPRAGLPAVWAVVDGFLEALEEHGGTLVGGNLSRSPLPTILDTTVIGQSRGERILARSGARPGDSVFVTGRLGMSEAGRRLLEGGWSGERILDAMAEDTTAGVILRAHLDPQPRLAEGQALASMGGVSACMDLSDGLVRDLPRLCRASDVGARVDLSAVPGVAEPAEPREDAGWDRLAVAGGEDYELLFTSAREVWPPEWSGTEVTRIGVITDRAGAIAWLAPDGSEVAVPTGWDHLSL